MINHPSCAATRKTPVCWYCRRREECSALRSEHGEAHLLVSLLKKLASLEDVLDACDPVQNGECITDGGNSPQLSQESAHADKRLLKVAYVTVLKQLYDHIEDDGARYRTEKGDVHTEGRHTGRERV